MRLFIAIEFEDAADYLKQIQEQLPDAKATFPKQFHLTLKFLGEVEEDKVEEIKNKLSKVKFEPFAAKLGEIGVFPSESFIRVVWVGVEDGEKIIQLQQEIENTLTEFKQDKRFHPHITLARIKFIEEEKKKEFVEALKNIKVGQKESEIKNFKLIKSTLTPESPVYEDLAVFQ
jgi:2'-5' RNA ligase